MSIVQDNLYFMGKEYLDKKLLFIYMEYPWRNSWHMQ